MTMPPRWGFSSSGVVGYKHVAPPELKNGSSAAARTAALIQWQWSYGLLQPDPLPGTASPTAQAPAFTLKINRGKTRGWLATVEIVCPVCLAPMRS